MDIQEKIHELKTEIKKLQAERDLAILEKGFSANANQDLRENAQYDYWLEKEFFLTGKIQALLNDINKLLIKQKKEASPKKSKADSKPKTKDASLTAKHKWL